MDDLLLCTYAKSVKSTNDRELGTLKDRYQTLLKKTPLKQQARIMEQLAFSLLFWVIRQEIANEDAFCRASRLMKSYELLMQILELNSKVVK